jgi:hypothetical protein
MPAGFSQKVFHHPELRSLISLFNPSVDFQSAREIQT